MKKLLVVLAMAVLGGCAQPLQPLNSVQTYTYHMAYDQTGPVTIEYVTGDQGPHQFVTLLAPSGPTTWTAGPYQMTRSAGYFKVSGTGLTAGSTVQIWAIDGHGVKSNSSTVSSWNGAGNFNLLLVTYSDFTNE